jgi:hypothetical protein
MMIDVGADLIVLPEKCTMQYVPNVGSRHRYLSNQQRIGLSIAEIATRRRNPEDSDIDRIFNKIYQI